LRPFYRNERDSSNVTFYEYVGGVKYVSLKFWDARAVQLFPNPTQSLLLFVPNERSGLHMVEDGLKDFSVSKLLCQMRDRHARIRLPNFTVDSETDLLPAYKDVLGVEEIKIQGLNLSITELKQKVRITLTAENDLRKSPRYSYNNKSINKRRRPSTRINLDRPFIFYLLDQQTEATLAIGRVTDVPADPENEELPVAESEASGTKIRLHSDRDMRATRTL